MRWILGFLSLTATACAAASPPATVVTAAPQPAAPAVTEGPAPKIKRLHGAWGWNDDVEVFRDGGKGTYFRDGAVCYEFVFEIAGDVVTKTADRDHTCGVGRTSSYRFHFEHGELVMKHVGSGFESRWKPAHAP